MKKFKILAVLACVVFTLSSCEKEEIQKPQESLEQSKEKNFLDKSGGGVEEDPIIIYGLTQNISNVSIADTEVILFDSNTSTPIDTAYSDSHGEFQFEEISGTYYFVASASGYSVLTSSNMVITTSSTVTLTLLE
ncbi:MAG: carboxypeptidase regulatory-like domain-containing protein [Flavobacteriales bacterium]|nr:carboxypeptidase regulatory-like domain-containing protein [Flavobacteriales bacterium]